MKGRVESRSPEEMRPSFRHRASFPTFYVRFVRFECGWFMDSLCPGPEAFIEAERQ